MTEPTTIDFPLLVHEGVRCDHGQDACAGVMTDCCGKVRPTCSTVTVPEAGEYCRDGRGCSIGR